MITELKKEMEDLGYSNFYFKIDKELKSQHEFDNLRAQEQEYNQLIKKVNEDQRNAQDESARDEHEMNQDILDQKKSLNETKTEAELHI